VQNLKGAPKSYIGYGDEPELSQWNIDKFDFLKRINKRTIKKKNKAVLEGLLNQKKQLELCESKLMMENREDSPEFDNLIKKINEINDEIEKVAGPMYTPRDPKNRYISIILFDEIEKASEGLHKLLLGIMDKAELNCGPWGVTDFSNSFIFMTSNIGSDKMREYFQEQRKERMGFTAKSEEEIATEQINDDDVYKIAKLALEESFPSEFLRRLDEYIVFRKLDSGTIEEIFHQQIEELQQRLANLTAPYRPIADRLPIRIVIDPEVKKFLINKSLRNPELGASQLGKMIRRYIIRRYLARGKNTFRIAPDDTVHFKLENNKIVAYTVREKKEKTK